jgi:hypothetical protein
MESAMVSQAFNLLFALALALSVGVALLAPI